MSVENPRNQFFVLTILAAMLLFIPLRRTGLAGYDDAFFAHQGKEIALTGEWWTIHLNGIPSFVYPPLYIWLEAASFKVFGIHDFAAKLPTALLGLGTIVLIYFLTLELTGQAWLSLLAMLVLASTQFFIKNATHAMTDVPFTFFFTLVIFFYLKGLRKPVFLTLLGLPLGLALLTRSVVGLLAVGIIVTHAVLTKRHKLLWSPWLAAGLVLGLTLPAIWYISQYQLHGIAAVESHLRFVGSKIQVEQGSNNWRTLLNYPVSLLKYYWPWLPFLVTGLVLQARAMIRGKDAEASLLIVWILFILIPLSIVQTRYPRYIMPAYPAFAILSAIALERLIPQARREVFFKAACAVGFLAVCLTILVPPKARADDIQTLAPIADLNCPPGERVLFYTYEGGREDYEWQFLWYGRSFTELASDLSVLASRLKVSKSATVIVDKQSYEKLQREVPAEITQHWKVLRESEKLLCFRSQ
jgi:4-amino-4-deoxy-L-arabinose transferase-like glycosyltransferase